MQCLAYVVTIGRGEMGAEDRTGGSTLEVRGWYLRQAAAMLAWAWMAGTALAWLRRGCSGIPLWRASPMMAGQCRSRGG